MPSSQPLILPFSSSIIIIFIFTFFLLQGRAKSIHQRFEACAPQSCGNQINISRERRGEKQGRAEHTDFYYERLETREMASSSSSSFMGLLVVLVVAALLQCATAATYTVGDTTGWTIPSGGAQFYSNWAGGKTFVVGDILSFNFSPQSHDVATVTKAQNDACTSEGNIIRTSPANITLSTAGNYYFICTFSGHCPAGQKLTINVVSSSTATPTTPPTVSAGGPSPPPTSGDSTPPNVAPSLVAGFGTAGIVAAVFSTFFL